MDFILLAFLKMHLKLNISEIKFVLYKYFNMLFIAFYFLNNSIFIKIHIKLSRKVI